MTTHQEFDRTSLQREIQEILVASAGVSPEVFETTASHTLSELGLESLAAMELQAIVEQRYGARIPDDSVEMSIPQIVAYIEAEMKEVR